MLRALAVQESYTMEFIRAREKDGQALAEIRAIAMKPSLVALGRFDENRVRNRFLDKFDPKNTYKILINGNMVGFYVMLDKGDHLYLDHLYLLPDFQGQGLGGGVMTKLKSNSNSSGKPIRLGALRGSSSNTFYLKHGFKQTHEDDYDIYYQFN